MITSRVRASLAFAGLLVGAHALAAGPSLPAGLVTLGALARVTRGAR